jgi:hypothetical protein
MKFEIRENKYTEPKGQRLLMISQNQEESRYFDALGNKVVDDDGLITNVVGQVRLADGYGEHYVVLMPVTWDAKTSKAIADATGLKVDEEARERHEVHNDEFRKRLTFGSTSPEMKALLHAATAIVKYEGDTHYFDETESLGRTVTRIDPEWQKLLDNLESAVETAQTRYDIEERAIAGQPVTMVNLAIPSLPNGPGMPASRTIRPSKRPRTPTDRSRAIPAKRPRRSCPSASLARR